MFSYVCVSPLTTHNARASILLGTVLSEEVQAHRSNSSKHGPQRRSKRIEATHRWREEEVQPVACIQIAAFSATHTDRRPTLNRCWDLAGSNLHRKLPLTRLQMMKTMLGSCRAQSSPPLSPFFCPHWPWFAEFWHCFAEFWL